MSSHPRPGSDCPATDATTARHLVRLLGPLIQSTEGHTCTQPPEHTAPPSSTCREIFSAIEAFVPTLIPNNPIFVAFHNGMVHDPLGGGSYAFQNDILGPVLSALVRHGHFSNVEDLAYNIGIDADPEEAPVHVIGQKRVKTFFQITPSSAHRKICHSSAIKMAPSRRVPAKLPLITQSTLDSSFIQQAANTRMTTAVLPSRHNVDRVSKKSPPTKSKSKSKSKSKPVVSDNRVLTDVLLAIKPIHLANIASKQKNHEYRKYRLRDGVSRLWLYETREGGEGRASITHIAIVPDSVRHTPGTVPTEPFGIGNDDFNAGHKESRYGYPVLGLYELVRPVTLAEMKSRWGMRGAPMGWRYLTADLWQDRWGDEQGRAERASRVF